MICIDEGADAITMVNSRAPEHLREFILADIDDEAEQYEADGLSEYEAAMEAILHVFDDWGLGIIVTLH